MDWSHIGDKPLPKPMMTRFTDACISTICLNESIEAACFHLMSFLINTHPFHYTDVIMDTIASQITSLTIVYSTVYSDADQRKYQSSASLAFVRGIHRGPVNSPHKWPVTLKMFPFDDVIMQTSILSVASISAMEIFIGLIAALPYSSKQVYQVIRVAAGWWINGMLSLRLNTIPSGFGKHDLGLDWELSSNSKKYLDHGEQRQYV